MSLRERRAVLIHESARVIGASLVHLHVLRRLAEFQPTISRRVRVRVRLETLLDAFTLWAPHEDVARKHLRPRAVGLDGMRSTLFRALLSRVRDVTDAPSHGGGVRGKVSNASRQARRHGDGDVSVQRLRVVPKG